MQESKKERVRGTILEAFTGGLFKTKLDSGEEILAYLAGKMRIHRIKVLPGDKVLIEMSGYDKNRGRIIRRL